MIYLFYLMVFSILGFLLYDLIGLCIGVILALLYGASVIDRKKNDDLIHQKIKALENEVLELKKNYE